MEKVLVLEDGIVNEYEVDYNQEYMDLKLEEYRRSFSVLRQENLYTAGRCSMDAIKDVVVYFDDIASFTVSTDSLCGENDLVRVDLIGSINPVVYNILVDENKRFCVNNSKLAALISWYKVIEENQDSHNNEIGSVNDFYNLNEKKNIKSNIRELFDGVSLRYVGRCDEPTKDNNYTAKCTGEFIKEFDINVEKDKKLVK